MDYPEHEKLHAVVEESQACGEFYDWLQSKGYTLCESDERNPERFWPVHRPITDLLAERFGIDQEKLEDEKRAMLDELRALN